MSTVDLAGDPREALARLIGPSWRLVARSRALLIAAQKNLPPGRIRSLHAQPVDRVLLLVTRGQEEGVFRHSHRDTRTAKERTSMTNHATVGDAYVTDPYTGRRVITGRTCLS